MFRGVTLTIALLGVMAACDDDEKAPESVPFEGLDPKVQPKEPTVLPDPTIEPSASASAAPKPSPHVKSQGGKLSACCAALAAVGRTSPDPGQRQNAKAASRVCVTKLSEVRQGKLSTSAALSQVRSSILGTAPGACR